MIDTPSEFLDKLEALDRNRAERLLRIERYRRDIANEVRVQYIKALDLKIGNTAPEPDDYIGGLADARIVIEDHKVTW